MFIDKLYRPTHQFKANPGTLEFYNNLLCRYTALKLSDTLLDLFQSLTNDERVRFGLKQPAGQGLRNPVFEMPIDMLVRREMKARSCEQWKLEDYSFVWR